MNVLLHLFFPEKKYTLLLNQGEHWFHYKMRVTSGELHSSLDNQIQVQTGASMTENWCTTQLDAPFVRVRRAKETGTRAWEHT